MVKKPIVGGLNDYNLLLLRSIYDAYEERADKVLKQFRSDRNNVLRKRYMVPVINPNYDYEKMLKEMKEKGKLREREDDEDGVDGQTVCAEEEQ